MMIVVDRGGEYIAQKKKGKEKLIKLVGNLKEEKMYSVCTYVFVCVCVCVC